MIIRGFDCNLPLTLDKYKDLKSKGYSFAGRYYSDYKVSKLLTRQDAENISKAGLDIVAIFENNPTNPEYFSYTTGVTDLLTATQRAIEAGQAKGSAIYFTVNFGAQPVYHQLIDEYFKGICDEMKHFTAEDELKRFWKIGIYGSYPVVNYIRLHNKSVNYIWQTYSWSNGRVHPESNIYQYKNNVKVLGTNINNNRGKTTKTSGIGSFSLNK
jgi:hypothetical protein